MRSSRLVRVALLGLCAGVVVSGTVGCSAFRKEWPSRRMAREYTPAAPRPDVTAPAVEGDQFVHPRLNTLPAGVQASIVRDNPDAQIVSVEQVPSGTGPMMYRVTALQGGVPVVSNYRSTGADLSPAEVIVYRPNDYTGRAKAKYAAEAEAGIPAKGTESGAVD